MKWVTREHPHTDRIACPWLIRTFMDPDAKIVGVRGDEALSFAEREGAIAMGVPGGDALYAWARLEVSGG